MKIFRKVLVLVATLALLTSVVGPFNAEAATKPTLNKTSRTIYVGGSSVNSSYSDGYYILKVNNRPSKYSVSWSSNNISVASVEKYGSSKYKAKVTAKAVGTATITATVIDKSTKPNTLYTLQCKITVKKNAGSLVVLGAPVSLEPGKEAQLSATLYNKSGAVASDGELTDITKWVSSNPEIATVDSNGKVTAASNLSTKTNVQITAYAVQAPSGTYSTIERATAKQTVTIAVEPSAIRCISSLQQKSLNTIEVNFAKDYSTVITKDNLSVKNGAYTVPVESIIFNAEGTKATIKASSSFAANSTYTVEFTNTGATADTKASFVASAGLPVRMELYTEIGGNKVIAGTSKLQPILFRLYDGNGVDVTPIAKADYDAYASCITLSTPNNNSGAGMVSGMNVMLYEPNKTLLVEANMVRSFYLGASNSEIVRLSSQIELYSVSEASTITMDKVTVTDSTLADDKLDWNNPKTIMAAADSNRRIVARVKGIDGKYIYSTANSKFSFKVKSGYENIAVVFGDLIYPYSQGTVVVDILYDNVEIGNAVIEIGSERVPQRVVLKHNNIDISGRSVEMSNSVRGDVAKERIDIAIYDQYQDIYKLTELAPGSGLINEIEVESENSSSYFHPMVTTYANADGTGYMIVDASMVQNVTSSGSPFGYRIVLKNGSTSTNKIVIGGFQVFVRQPVDSAPSSFNFEVTGTTDMTINESTSLPLSLSISLFELKGGVKYNQHNVYSSEYYASASGEYFYEVTGPNGSVLVINNGEPNKLNIVSESADVISKFAPGKYIFRAYHKVNSQKVPVGNAVEIVLKDTVSDYAIARIDSSTGTPADNGINIGVSNVQSTLREVFSKYYKITVGNTDVLASNIANIKCKEVMNGDKLIAIIISEVKFYENVTLGNTTKKIEHTIPCSIAIAKAAN